MGDGFSFAAVTLVCVVSFLLGSFLQSVSADMAKQKSITTGAMIHDGKLYVIQQIGGK